MFNDSAPAGKERKYARRERERRFLFAVPPDGAAVRTAEIVDRYLLGTRIRLRRETTGRRATYKLTQKVPAPDGAPGLITTMYLDADEYAALARLPAASLHKTRLSIPPLGVDLFEGALDGLILGEVEFDDDESMARFAVPRDAVGEVTLDQRLTGGRLVTTTRSGLAEVLAGYGLSP